MEAEQSLRVRPKDSPVSRRGPLSPRSHFQPMTHICDVVFPGESTSPLLDWE